MSLRTRVAVIAGVTVALAASVIVVVLIALTSTPSVDPADTFTRAAAKFGFDSTDRDRPLPPALQARRNLVETLWTPDGRSFEQVLDQLDADRRRAEITNIVTVTAIAVGVLTAATVTASWLVARRVLRRVHELTNGARRVAALDLEPISLGGPHDELRELGDTIDAMLVHMAATLEAHRRFAIDIAHELRTPIAAIVSNAELSLAEPTPGEPNDAQLRARSTLVEAQRCASLIDRLLTVARIQTSNTVAEIDLADITANVTARNVELATTRNVELVLELEDATVRGDAVLIAALLDNLIRNAIVHNHANGRVETSVECDGTTARVTIVNTGHHVNVHDLEKRGIQRDDGSDGDGSGVGLSIAQSIIDIHDGTMTLTPIDSGGLHAVIELRAVPDAHVTLRYRQHATRS